MLSLNQQVQAGCDSVDILHTVLQLRERRPKMVQTQEQYSFIYQCLSHFIHSWVTGEDRHDGLIRDKLLDAGLDNFGFEHVKL